MALEDQFSSHVDFHQSHFQEEVPGVSQDCEPNALTLARQFINSSKSIMGRTNLLEIEYLAQHLIEPCYLFVVNIGSK